MHSTVSLALINITIYLHSFRRCILFLFTFTSTIGLKQYFQPCHSLKIVIFTQLSRFSDDDYELPIECHNNTTMSYKCPKCSDKFALWQDLNKHFFSLHTRNTFRTNVVEQISRPRKKVSREKPKISYNCPKCPETFPNVKELNKHFYTIHTRNPFRANQG